MRKATLAKLTLTAVVGLGGILGQATMASAGPGPQQGSIKVGPAPTTTMKPIEADPVDYCDLHLCLPADEVDPEPPKSCGEIDCIPAEEVDPEEHSCGIIDCLPAEEYEPQDTPKCPKLAPNCDKIEMPQPGCQTTHGCPGDEVPCSSEDDARTQCDPPCDEDRPIDSAPRIKAGEDCGGGTDGGTDGTDGTDGTTDGTTTDGGTDGHDGRLPKTGVEIMSLVGLGAGGVGIGAVLKRLGRRSKDQ